MATLLTKSVKRLTASRDRKGRALVVSLEPGDYLSFRPKGKRKAFTVTINQAYLLAQIVDQNWRYRKAIEAYNEARKAGKRARRPKVPSQIFDRIYYAALKKG